MTYKTRETNTFVGEENHEIERPHEGDCQWRWRGKQDRAQDERDKPELCRQVYPSWDGPKIDKQPQHQVWQRVNESGGELRQNRHIRQAKERTQ